MNTNGDIKVYSFDGCHRCEEAERFLVGNAPSLSIVNVTNNLDLQAELINATQQMEMPVVFIGQEVFCGDDANNKNLEEALKRYNANTN